MGARLVGTPKIYVAVGYLSANGFSASATHSRKDVSCRRFNFNGRESRFTSVALLHAASAGSRSVCSNLPLWRTNFRFVVPPAAIVGYITNARLPWMSCPNGERSHEYRQLFPKRRLNQVRL